MKTGNIISGDFDEVVFENRNKEYGAYEIRKKYDKNVTLGLLGAVSILAIIVLSSFVSLKNFVSAKIETGPAEVELINLKKEFTPPPIKNPLPPPPPVEKVKFTAPVVKADSLIDEKDILSSDAAENVNNVPIDTASGYEIVEPDKNNAVIDEGPSEVVLLPEEYAEFPGGEEMLFKFLGDNIKYPREAVENNLEDKVFIEFIIGKDGRVSEPKILRGEYKILNEEALRVISLMPVWTPAKQGGRPVKTAMKLPVAFRLKN